MNNQSHSKRKLAVAVVLALSSVAANAEMFELGAADSNFTMFDPRGNAIGGMNDVVATWDGTFNTDVSTAVTNMTLSSVSTFFGNQFFIHDVQVFSEGSYVFEACPGPIDPDTNQAADGSTCTAGVSAPQTMVVGEGQAGVHMLFDWNSNVNIDVVNVWDMNAAWGFGPNDGTTSSVLESAGTACAGSKGSDPDPAECQAFLQTEWLFTATDPDGDGVPGSPMIDGPFQGFNVTFNVRPQVVPVPAAVWLMGSGLLGLVGVARRKKR